METEPKDAVSVRTQGYAAPKPFAPASTTKGWLDKQRSRITEQPFLQWLFPVLQVERSPEQETEFDDDDTRGGAIGLAVYIVIATMLLRHWALIPNLIKSFAYTAAVAAVFYGVAYGRVQKIVTNTVTLAIFPTFLLVGVFTNQVPASMMNEFYAWAYELFAWFLAIICYLVMVPLIIGRVLGLDINRLVVQAAQWLFGGHSKRRSATGANSRFLRESDRNFRDIKLD